MLMPDVWSPLEREVGTTAIMPGRAPCEGRPVGVAESIIDIAAAPMIGWRRFGWCHADA